MQEKQDSWLWHNTDKVMLFVLVVLGALLIIYLNLHGGDEKLLEFAETSDSTVLGALILILTGRISRADNQTANGLPPSPPATSTHGGSVNDSTGK